MDLNINGINSNKPIDKAVQTDTAKENEGVSVFGNNSDVQATEGDINPRFAQNGEIAGNKFTLRRRRNIIEAGFQIIGNIGGQSVDVEERSKPFSLSNKRTYKGNIGNNTLNMRSQDKVVSLRHRRTFTGTYNGKKFNLELSNEYSVGYNEDKVLKGTFDGKKVDNKFTRFSNDVKEGSVPKGYGDVATMIMVINSDQEDCQRAVDQVTQVVVK